MPFFNLKLALFLVEEMGESWENCPVQLISVENQLWCGLTRQPIYPLFCVCHCNFHYRFLRTE